MSNTLNTPVEALESELPVRIRSYAIRRGSGGKGRFRGGEGLRRDVQFLEPATVTILSERRERSPYGLQGGESGAPGENRLRTTEGEERLAGKVSRDISAGDCLSVQTPGGGGFGEPS